MHRTLHERDTEGQYERVPWPSRLDESTCWPIVYRVLCQGRYGIGCHGLMLIAIAITIQFSNSDFVLFSLIHDSTISTGSMMRDARLRCCTVARGGE